MLISMVFQALGSADEFMEKLPSFDADIEAQRKDAEASGEVSCLHFDAKSSVHNLRMQLT